MFLIFWLLLILSGFVWKKSKNLALLQLAFVVFIFASTTNGADYGNYLSLFHNLISSARNIASGNILFNLLLYLFSFTGNYNAALFFIAIIMMAILYKAIIYYTDNVAFVLSMYLITPFVIDVIQVKNFIAMILWFYFSRYLYQVFLGENKIHNTCMYLLGVTIAAGFHFSFIIMYIFILIPWLKLKKMVIFSAGFSMAGILLLNRNIIDTIVDIMKDSDFAFFQLVVSKIYDYTANFSYEKMQTRLTVTLILYIIMVMALVALCLLRKFARIDKQNHVLEFLITLNLAIAIIFPFMPYSREIYRVQRNLLLINYALMAIFVKDRLIHDGKLRLNSLLTELYCIGIAAFYLFFDCIYWNYASVFVPVFHLHL